MKKKLKSQIILNMNTKKSKDLELLLNKREMYKKMFNKLDMIIEEMNSEDKFYPVKSFNFSC